MRYLLLCTVLAVGVVGCKDTVYRDADKATYEAISPEYRAYVGSDAKLSPAQKARRINTVDTWGIRCGAITSGVAAVRS